jgi:hypothetical protein
VVVSLTDAFLVCVCVCVVKTTGSAVMVEAIALVDAFLVCVCVCVVKTTIWPPLETLQSSLLIGTEHEV